jgi:type II secretory ATPase GspE/PulE/Tfp pilus assembly ATPase PilB-like protein
MVIHAKEVISKLPANQILSAILEKGLEVDANFIHLEPINDVVRVKYRVAGSLINGPEISKKRFSSLSDKIKNLANIKTGYTDLISGGKFKYSFNSQSFNIRVYIMPTINGEKITFKIQNDAPVSNTLAELGFWGSGLESIEQAINLKSGLILVTGPNDSGKSKTIATLLESINDHSVSVATLEDPVEYKISRANQTQINHKTNLNFKNGIKILLKQDNDVIMLSELIDSGTINEALEIVAHKKLVISSLNVDSAVETISRILDYGISPASLAYSLRIIINQRLVKKLCSDCKQYVAIDKENANKINKLFGLSNPTNMKYIHNLEIDYNQHKLTDKKIGSRLLSTSETKIKKIWVNNPAGCSNCLNTGFKGRIAVTEILRNSQEIERLIITKSKDLLINKQAVREGMVNYLIDGLLKVLVGETTIDEVIKLTKSSYLT